MGYVTSGHINRYPLIIPASAPLITGERAIVYVQDMEEEEPTFEGKEVVLGPRAGDYYVVKSGLSEGDMVVVNGAFKIDGELQIRARPSMMNPKKEMEKTVFVAEKKVDLVKEPVSKEVRNSLEAIFNSYLVLSDALAADDYKTSMKAMKELKKKVDGATEGKGNNYKQYNSSIEKMKKKLSKMKIIKDISEARTMFEAFSDQTILLEKRYGHIMDKNIHLAFCPMAFSNKGAYWLQTRDVVNNPYFGSKMLKCGTIKDTFKPKK
jgi:Cu(I)/Ag(I) efflux system membrane fusion protein